MLATAHCSVFRSLPNYLMHCAHKASPAHPRGSDGPWILRWVLAPWHCIPTAMDTEDTMDTMRRELAYHCVVRDHTLPCVFRLSLRLRCSCFVDSLRILLRPCTSICKYNRPWASRSSRRHPMSPALIHRNFDVCFNDSHTRALHSGMTMQMTSPLSFGHDRRVPVPSCSATYPRGSA